MNAIEIYNLSKTYKGKKRSHIDALKNLTLAIPEGEVFGFLGPNGAGKSTTIKLLMGLIRPTSGHATVTGYDVASVMAKRNVGYLPENPAFYDFLNADEYLDFVGACFGMDKVMLAQRKNEILTLLELETARKRPMRGYSKGMVQRIGLAQVMIHDPAVYILDEPMSGLDPMGRALVKKIIMDLKSRGKCIFFSTHITADVESVCDRVGIILKGELKTVERVEDIMTTGIVGYNVRTMGSRGNVEEHSVDKNRLSSFIQEKSEAGDEIKLIEPKRKNLEEFFLDIVKGV